MVEDTEPKYTKGGWRIPSRWEVFWAGFLLGMVSSVVLNPFLIRFYELSL